MIPVNRLYKKLLMLANSDIRGNMKPSDAMLAIHDSVVEIVDEYFYEINRLLNRENRGLISGGLVNLPDRVQEKILYFLKEDVALTYSASYFALPADLRYIDSVWYQSTNEIEFCKSNQEFRLIQGSNDVKPTTQYPIGLLVGEKVKIAPTTIANNVTISYLRNPLIPNWTYNIVDDVELFNPSASDFQDIDLHISEENNVLVKTLKRFGINLKEQDLQGITVAEENKDFNQENAS